MNAAQVHLLFNHWPLILIFVGFFILLYAEIKNHHDYKKLGLFIFIAAALFTIPAQFSGEGAEHILMENNLANHDDIEHHEGFGFWSAMLAYGIGILSAISLFMINNVHGVFSGLRKLILLLAAGAIVLIAIAGHTGGKIRHPEISLTSQLIIP